MFMFFKDILIKKIDVIFKFDFNCISQMDLISIFMYIKFKVLIWTNIFDKWTNIDLKFFQLQKLLRKLLF